MREYRGRKALITNLSFMTHSGLKFQKKLRKSAAELIIVLIVGVVGSLTLSSYYIPSLSPSSQWFLAVTPLAVAFATFYLSISITRDRRAREMATVIYAPLLKEATSWLNRKGQNFGEWTKLKSEAVYWIPKVPKEIVKLFDKAYDTQKQMWDLRLSLNKLISQAMDRLSTEISARPGFENMVLTSNGFAIMDGNGGNQNPLYISWIWEAGQSLIDYADDYAKSNWGRDATWRLQTQVSPKGGGNVRSAGETKETEKLVGEILKFLGTQRDALEYQRKIVATQKLGQQALLLIGEELG